MTAGADLGVNSLLLGERPAELVLAVVICAQVDCRQPHQRGKEPQRVQQARHSQIRLRPVRDT